MRVALARAAYAESDIFIADDPLAAVDAHVGQFIFDHLFLGLLRDRTRLVVTNAVGALPAVSRIIVVARGAVAEDGTYEELMARAGEFAGLVAALQAQEAEGHAADEEADAEGAAAMGADGEPPRARAPSAPRRRASSNKEKKDGAEKKPAPRLVDDEERVEGAVQTNIYLCAIPPKNCAGFSVLYSPPNT